MVLVVLRQNAVEGGFRGDVPLGLVQQQRHNLGRRQAGVVGLVADGQDHGFLQCGQGMGWCGLWRMGPTILATRFPAAIGVGANAQFGTGAFETRSVSTRFIDQLHDMLAIQGAGQSSSSPQIARAFFRSVSRAAVSASAASLRFSSRSSCRVRFLSWLTASRERFSSFRLFHRGHWQFHSSGANDESVPDRAHVCGNIRPVRTH